MNVRETIGQKVKLVIKKRHFLSCCLGRLVTDQTQQPHTVGKQQGHKHIKEQIQSGSCGEKGEQKRVVRKTQRDRPDNRKGEEDEPCGKQSSI